MENVLAFLKKLKDNNNKEWFQANKAKFITAKETFEVLVTELIDEVNFTAVFSKGGRKNPNTDLQLFRVARPITDLSWPLTDYYFTFL